ncbi:MAG: ankyrin repeat domain-containing protein, partial [Lentisphaerae bacterium]
MDWKGCGLLCIFLVFSSVVRVYAGNGQDLIDAARNGDIAKLKLLLLHGADVDAKNVYGWTALMTASGSGY